MTLFRPCPRVDRYLWNCIYFYTFRPVIQTKTQFYINKNDLFWKLKSKWKFWKTLVLWFTSFFGPPTSQLVTIKAVDVTYMQALCVLVWTLMRTLLLLLFLQVYLIDYTEEQTLLLIQTKYPHAMFKSGRRHRMMGIHLYWLAQVSHLKNTDTCGSCMVWDALFDRFAPFRVWTKVFSKTNEGGYSFF